MINQDNTVLLRLIETMLWIHGDQLGTITNIIDQLNPAERVEINFIITGIARGAWDGHSG